MTSSPEPVVVMIILESMISMIRIFHLDETCPDYSTHLFEHAEFIQSIRESGSLGAQVFACLLAEEGDAYAAEREVSDPQ